MANFFHHLKRGECPICNGARKDCRKSTRTGLIHCRDDSVTSVLGWRLIKQDALGFNLWAVDDGRGAWSSERLEEWKRQQEARRRQQEIESAHRKARLLSVLERDRQYRILNQQLILIARHRQMLRDRDLTDTEIDEAISLGAVSTWNPGQRITGVSPELAGVDPTGLTRQLIGSDGFTIAAFDPDGHITGYQRKTDKGDPKYNWVSSEYKGGNGPHLPNGELPLFVWKHLHATAITEVWLCEGALKSMLVAFGLWRQGRTDIAVIGTASSARYGEKTLKAYLQQLGTQTLRLMPDAGAVVNPTIHRANQETLERCQQWGYAVTVGWWGQVDKSHPDIDELTSFDALAYLTPEEFLDLGSRSSLPARSFSGLFGWLAQLLKRFEKRCQTPWGFGRKGEVEVEPQPAPMLPAISYPGGERLKVWPTATQSSRNILDTSGTGSGKSFDAGRATPELFGARQIIYLSTEHRNPTTPTLKAWPDLEARHDGLYRDGFGKLRRVDNERQPYVVPPNCGRNYTINALRSKNIPGADTASLICQTCPYLEPCRGGAVFGYLNSRMESLQESRLRAHPNSLPSPDEYDYSSVVLLWEEAMELVKAHCSISVRAKDWQQVFVDLAVKKPTVFDALRPFLTSLHQYISGEIKQPNKYGWGDAQIRAALKVPDGINVETIRSALNPDLSFLNTTDDYGVDLADLPARLRKSFSDSDAKTAERVSRETALNWLPDLLDVLLGNVVGGSLRIQDGVLTITLPDTRLAEIARKAKANIFLDATASVEDLALVLGVDPSGILTVRQATPDPSNLEIIQVTTVGRLGVGNKRSFFCQQRLNALIKQIAIINQIQPDTSSSLAVMDFKRHTKSGDGKRRWWVDSRGLNDFEDCDVLVLVGVPCRNLSDLAAEFTVLHGRPPLEGTERVKYPIEVNGTPSDDLQPWFEMEVSTDPEFRDFCRRRILADIHQAIGRLRAHRRPGKKLRVYFIGDYPLDIPVTLRKASDITPDAATKPERFEMALRAAVQQLKDAGQKITQTAIAAITGYSQQYISRFKKLLQTLIEDLDSKSSNPSDPPPDPEETEWMSQVYLPMLAESPPSKLLGGVLNTFEAYGRAAFKAIWDAVPATTQIKILQSLFLTLPSSQLLALARSG